MKAEKERNV